MGWFAVRTAAPLSATTASMPAPLPNTSMPRPLAMKLPSASALVSLSTARVAPTPAMPPTACQRSAAFWVQPTDIWRLPSGPAKRRSPACSVTLRAEPIASASAVA
jgi:hypothetical protein